MLHYIMGLLNKKPTPKPKSNDFTLSTDEIKIILGGLQNSTFKGKDVEMVYSLILKLQDLYTKSLDSK